MASDEDPPADATATGDWGQRRDLFQKFHTTWRGTTEIVAADTRGFVERHLKAALPRGWVANFRIAREAQHIPSAELSLLHHEWRVFREGERPDDDEFEHYIVYVNARNQLVFVYGNRHGGDSSPHFTPDRYWEHAICIELQNLGVVLPFVFARPDEFPPNYYSRT